MSGPFFLHAYGLAYAVAVVAAVLCGGCSAARSMSSDRARSRPDLASARSVGHGSRFRPGPTGALVARARPVDGMRCRAPARIVAAAHVEVFAFGHVVVIPAGMGVAPPLRRRGAYVDGGRCAYPLWTVEPTRLLLTQTPRRLTLGQVFESWGQALTHRMVASFVAPTGAGVSVFIDGAPWRGDPSSAPIAAAAGPER